MACCVIRPAANQPRGKPTMRMHLALDWYKTFRHLLPFFSLNPNFGLLH